jgi:hypothetical protein
MSNPPRVEIVPIEEGATTDPSNINRHTARGRALVENSLQRRGAFRSIASAGKNVKTPVVYAGNLTLQTAVEAGFKEIVNVHVRGTQIINVVRDDIEPGSPEAVALGLEDNESAHQSLDYDVDALAALAAGDNALLIALRNEDKVFSRMLEGMANTPIFTPNLNPMFSTAKILDEDVVKEKMRLDNRFKENSEYLEVICPYCAKEFYLDKDDIK